MMMRMAEIEALCGAAREVKLSGWLVQMMGLRSC